VTKTFFGWCVGRAILDRSPGEGVKPPTQETARDRVLSDEELGTVITAAREIGGAFGAIVEILALTAQRRDEVAGMTWNELVCKTESGVFRVHGRRIASRTSCIEAWRRCGSSRLAKQLLATFSRGTESRSVSSGAGKLSWTSERI
jgi:integrase